MSNVPKGHFIAGLAISDTVFLAVTTLDQIQAYGLQPPKEMQFLKKKTASAAQITNSTVRKKIQRDFTAARIRRAEEQANYIEGYALQGKYGGMPCITLHHERALKTGTEHGDDGFYFPYNASLVAIDGETQTEGRFILRERKPDTGDIPFGIMVYHGIPKEGAQQILHDYNSYGIPVPEKQIMLFSTEGQLTKGIHAAIAASGADPTKFNRKSVTALKHQYASHTQLTYALMAYTAGIGAATRRTSAGAIKEANKAYAPAITDQAIACLTDLIVESSSFTLNKMHTDLWHVAGYLMSEGCGARDIKWAKGALVRKQLLTAKSRKIKLTTAEFLAHLIEAME